MFLEYINNAVAEYEPIIKIINVVFTIVIGARNLFGGIEFPLFGDVAIRLRR